MIGIRNIAIAALVSTTLTCATASTALAGLLNGHGAAFGGFTGSVSFNDGAGLAGRVDYAVFTAAAFNANFAGLGYVPGDAFVYTYQIESFGTATVDGFEVVLEGAANTSGAFGPLSSLVPPDIFPSTSAFLGSSRAQWLFAPGIEILEVSSGLAFSSPELPTLGMFEVFAGRLQTLLVAGVPTPFTTPVPEPNLGGLLLLSALAGFGWCRRRR